MAISYDEAKQLLSEVDSDYQGRHSDHARLREFWHGKFWQDAKTGGLSDLWRDALNPRQDMGPDFKLVRNLIFDVAVKYQSYLSGLPMIHIPAAKPGSRTARAQAQLKEDVIYGTWNEVNMTAKLNDGGWYGPLMGDWFLGIWPDVTRNTVQAIVRSPQYAYPLPGADMNASDIILFRWETTEAAAKRDYPTWRGGDAKRGKAKSVEVLEYSSGREFQRWVDGQRVNGVEHDFGFNLFEQVPFIRVPGEVWNHSAVEQAVDLVEAGSMLWSLEMQAAIEAVFPRLVLEDPMKFSEDIDTGPGAVIPVNPGGKAYYLSPPNAGGGVAMLQENERAIKQDTSMPDVNFGQFDASIITGKAVNALQGAGSGALVDMVQGASHGPALANWNAKALTIYQRMFAEDTIYLNGVRPRSAIDLNPRQFPLRFKGKEIVGSPRNDVVFGPYIDQHSKLVMTLQAQGAGLVSKAYSREQIGVTDSDQMQAEITGEVIEEAVIGAVILQLQSDPSAEAGDAAEANVASYLSGGPVRAPLTPGPPPGAPPALPQGNVSSPPLALPPGSPEVAAPDVAAAATPGGPASAGVTLQTAQDTLSTATITGRAWLVGEIVARGQAAIVEVAVTDPADRQALADAADFEVSFVVVNGAPEEQAVEIGVSVG